jgi:hypothetical protein
MAFFGGGFPFGGMHGGDDDDDHFCKLIINLIILYQKTSWEVDLELKRRRLIQRSTTIY